MTNYTELADRIVKYLKANQIMLRAETISILEGCEAFLRSIPEPETPSKTCWLAKDDDGGNSYLCKSDPTYKGKFFEGGEHYSRIVPEIAIPLLAPGQKCRVTFGPIIDCNPPKEPEKSLGQVIYEAEPTYLKPWGELSQQWRDEFDKRAAAVVAEHERRKNK